MNKFKYIAALKQLEQCKTIKQLEKLLRGYESATPCHFYTILRQPFEQFTLNYKLYSKALNLYNQRSRASLPDFLYDNIKQVQKEIFDLMFNYHEKNRFQTLTYEELIDIFEFNDTLHMRSSSTTLFELDQLVKNKPVLFTISFNTKLTQFSDYSLVNLQTHKLLVQAIKYKQQVLKNKKHTICEMYIEYLKKHMSPIDTLASKNIDEDIDNLKHQIKALQTLRKM